MLRSVADPDNQLYESAAKRAPDCDSAKVNESITYFQVANDAITIDGAGPTLSLLGTRVLPNAS